MAIVVEEEQHSKVNIVSILVWLVVLGLVVSTVYVVFFKVPPLIEQAVPVTFQTTQVLSEIKIKPEEIVQSQLFNSLQRYVPPVSSGLIESPRPNPFQVIP